MTLAQAVAPEAHHDTSMGRARSRAAEALVAVVVFLGSLLTPIGYDEAYWIAVVRMVLGGRPLYGDVLDNKSPLIHTLTWLVDVAPGSFIAARATALALTAVWIGRLIKRRLGAYGFAGVVTGSFAGIWSAALSEFKLTVELPALLFILIASGRQRAWSKAVFTIVAMGWDPRVVLLVPALAVALDADTRERSKYLLAIAVSATLAAVIVFSTPDLRFAFVDFSVAAHEAYPLDAIRVLGMCLAPTVVLLALGWRPRWGVTRALWAVGVGAIGFLSLSPFVHYWVYLVALIPALLVPPARAMRLLPVALSILAVVPLLAHHAQISAGTRILTDDQLTMASVIRESIGDGKILYVGGAPFLASELARQNLLRSPTAHYLVFGTTRVESHRAELKGFLAQADAVVFDLRNGRLVFEDSEIERQFPCVVTSDMTEVRFREVACSES